MINDNKELKVSFKHAKRKIGNLTFEISPIISNKNVHSLSRDGRDYVFYALTHARFACHVFRQIQNCILLSFNVIYLLPSFMSAIYALMLLFTIIKMLIQIFCLTLPRTIYIY